MSAPGKLVRSSRWKTGPSKGQRPLGSECCVVTGDSSCEAYTAIAWGVGLSLVRSYIAGAEGFHRLEGNMCGTAMRGADAPSTSGCETRPASRRRGSRARRVLPAAMSPPDPPIVAPSGRRAYGSAIWMPSLPRTRGNDPSPQHHASMPDLLRLPHQRRLPSIREVRLHPTERT
jgi:hypothetical protein